MARRLEQLILGIFDWSIEKSEVIYQVSIVSFQMVISNMADMLQLELCGVQSKGGAFPPCF
jgi:hypothetical protein